MSWILETIQFYLFQAIMYPDLKKIDQLLFKTYYIIINKGQI